MDQFLIDWIEGLINTHIIQGNGKDVHTVINKEYSHDEEYSGSNGLVVLTLETSYVLNATAPANLENLNAFEKAFNAQRENIEVATENNIAIGELKSFTNRFNKGVGQIITTEYKYETIN